MKKIILAIPNLGGGGSERVVSVWANYLCEADLDVNIICFYRSEDEYFFNKKIKIHCISNNQEDYLKLSKFQRIKILYKIIKKIKPDYIISFLHVMQMLILFTTFFSNIKRIETMRSNPWTLNVGGVIKKNIMKLCYLTAHKIIIQASDQREYFSRKIQHKIVLIHNPIGEQFLGLKYHQIKDNVIEFVSVSRICEQKNIPMMIEAFALACKKHPKIRLKIYGKGEPKYVDFLKKKVENLHMENNIYFMGKANDVQKIYLENDVFLTTSNAEGLPNSLIEAMASGLICLSTNFKTGLVDLIDDEVNGFISRLNDKIDYANKIENIIKLSKNRRLIISNNAILKINDICSKKNTVLKLYNLFKN